MSYIPCGSDCIYQEEGLCNLRQAGSPGIPGDAACVYFVQRSGAKNSGKNNEDEIGEDPDGSVHG